MITRQQLEELAIRVNALLEGSGNKIRVQSRNDYLAIDIFRGDNAIKTLAAGMTMSAAHNTLHTMIDTLKILTLTS